MNGVVLAAIAAAMFMLGNVVGFASGAGEAAAGCVEIVGGLYK